VVPAGFPEDLVERFDHVALAVRSIPDTLPLVELLGGRFLQGADHSRNGFRWVHFRLADGTKLELIQPIRDDCFLHRFLASGEGVHHLTFKVADVEEAARRVQAAGFETVGLHLDPAWSEVFIHPRSSHGVLIQLAAWEDDLHWQGPSLDDVLAGRVLDTS
jgi:methylmalonyl-CoA/ethylmalonyl-CoA epimerase